MISLNWSILSKTAVDIKPFSTFKTEINKKRDYRSAKNKNKQKIFLFLNTEEIW